MKVHVNCIHYKQYIQDKANQCILRDTLLAAHIHTALCLKYEGQHEHNHIRLLLCCIVFLNKNKKVN